MDMKMLPVYIIIALVFIGLPILLSRLTGRNPMEILFGERVNDTLFGKKKKEDDASGAGEKDGAGTGPSGKSAGKGAKKKAAKPQTNSSKQEFMTAISDLMTYARRNRFYCIMPGTLMHGNDVATLAVLMVTRSGVLGFNFFGYGGTVYAGSGDGPWKQVLNGEEKEIESPTVKNKKQKEIVDAVLQECGFSGVKSEIFGVFTASGVILKDARNTRCHAQKALMENLKAERFQEDRGVDMRAVGKALEVRIKKAENKKAGKNS